MNFKSLLQRLRLLDTLRSWRRIVGNVLLLVVGSSIFAVGLNSVLVPKQFLSGGVIGVSLIIHYLVPSFNTGLVYFILNIPLILLGWFSVSKRFMAFTSFGMVVFSIAAGTIHPPPFAIENPILAALLGGVICGIGAGITLRSQGSGGGFDILAVYLNKKFGLRVGTAMFIANAAVLLAGAYFFSLELALYSLMYVYVSGKAINTVLTGFNQRKSVLIVSDEAQTIASQIMNELNRGVTFLEGIGGYTGEHKQVILSIITLTELPKMKEMIFDIDPDAFVVVNDTLEVLGKRHGTLRVY